MNLMIYTYSLFIVFQFPTDAAPVSLETIPTIIYLIDFVVDNLF